MKLQRQIKTAAALTLSALAVAGPATAGSGLNGYRDAHERGAAVTSGKAAIAYFVANELSTLTQASGDAAIKYFHDNELRGPGRRASLARSTTTAALAGYLDAPERGQPERAISPTTQVGSDDNSGFDWEAAVVGASSALMLGLLIGVGLLTARRFRDGHVAH